MRGSRYKLHLDIQSNTFAVNGQFPRLQNHFTSFIQLQVITSQEIISEEKN